VTYHSPPPQPPTPTPKNVSGFQPADRESLLVHKHVVCKLLERALFCKIICMKESILLNE